jgi:L-alanine-DL-glutamate epimerase-like enolase superfamily enzyme
MKIKDIQAIPVSMPTGQTKTALGVFTTFEYIVVVVTTDEGIDGLGEVSMLWDGASKTQKSFIEGPFRERLIGQDPLQISLCLQRMSLLIEQAWPARAGIEMALYDIAGKALKVPAYQLLGGKVRDAVVLSHSIMIDTPEEMAANATKFVEEGFTCVKVKIGLDADHDVKAVAAVRQAVGDNILLRVDANMGWRTAKEAIRNIKRLEPYDLHSVEQPLPRADLSEIRLIRASVDTPIMLDESVWGPHDAWQILRVGAADILNVYVAESGGLSNSSLIFRMAETAGIPCVIGAMPELGIGTAAAVHLGLAMTNLHDPCDACGAIYQVADVVNERFEVHHGEIRPLDGPGLGVTLDLDALARYRCDGL